MDKDRYNFQKLTPDDKVDLKVYDEALNFVFDNPDLKNIAISGAYSSGKSSVIASFENSSTLGKKFLHISLAHFQPQDETDDSDSTELSSSQDKPHDEKYNEAVLEGKILNQLIHQIEPNKIPQTSFRVKQEVTIPRVLGTTLSFAAIIVSISYFIWHQKWNKCILSLPKGIVKKLLISTTSKYTPLVILGIFSAISISFLWKIIRIQYDRNIVRKLSLQGNDIEIFTDSDDSYFDKYLNEVLYLFDHCDADVIVFEDIDRFDMYQIFERLHEVNRLVNISRAKRKKSPLRFFYLIRDDIFTNKDRTKFFDLVIPVVPVIDGSNSYDQFIKILQAGGVYDIFDSGFLEKISLYIDDMRLLKNIYNEFRIYYERINNTNLNPNKMLAMIAYKNVFPRDFADLQLGKGFVHELFSQRESLYKHTFSDLTNKITDLENEIKKKDTEHLQSIDEVHMLYDWKRDRTYRYSNEYRRLNEEEEQRKKALQDILSTSSSELKAEINKLRSEIVTITSKKLSKLLTRDNIDSYFSSISSTNENAQEETYLTIKNSLYFKLLVFLIREGYIDEEYSDYMTYFYAESMSRNDKLFLLSITDKVAKEAEYSIDNPELVVSKLRLPDFSQPEALNYALLQYLLGSGVHPEYLQNLLLQLKNAQNFGFISGYFHLHRDSFKFVYEVNKSWNMMLYSALIKQVFLPDELYEYVVLSLSHCTDDVLLGLNHENKLKEYIEEKSDFLCIQHPKTQAIIDSFAALEIRFHSIIQTGSHPDLLNGVYAKSMYDICFDNLCLMINCYYGDQTEEAIRHHNYTIVASKKDEPLYKYIQSELSVYLGKYLDFCNNTINDDAPDATLLLNNPDISAEAKKQYIQYLITVIPCLTEINDVSLWSDLLSQKNIAYSPENIALYALKIGTIDHTLVEFINDNCSEQLDFSQQPESVNEDQWKKLFSWFASRNDISDTKYEEIILSFNRYYTRFSISNLEKSKIIILIIHKIIRMNSDNLNFIRSNYGFILVEFILTSKEQYLADVSHLELNSIEMENLLCDNRLSDEERMIILQGTHTKVSILRRKFSNEVNSFIVNNRFVSDDMSELAQTYNEWGNGVKEYVLTYFRQNWNQILRNPSHYSNELIYDILKHGNLSQSDQVELFVANLPSINGDIPTITKYLNVIGCEELTKVFGYQHPTVTANKINSRILDVFKMHKYISDYKEIRTNDKEKYLIAGTKKKNRK